MANRLGAGLAHAARRTKSGIGASIWLPRFMYWRFRRSLAGVGPSKVTLHCQGVPDYVGEYLAKSGATHVKVIGNYKTYPGVQTIGRVYYPQGQVDDRVLGGANGADAIFAACWEEINKNPQVHIWETPANEASIWNPAIAGNYVAFNQRLIQRFHQAGKKIIIGAINVGWPRLPYEDGGAMMNVVARACQGADGISFHEYGVTDDMRKGETFYCLRYRRFHTYCQNNGFSHPPIYITECGLDRTTPPGPDFGHAGWKVILNGNEAAYVEQLIWYEKELRKDNYVKCATIFTAGPSGWESFDMNKSVSMRLAAAQAALGPGPDPDPDPDPEPEPTDIAVEVYDSAGNAQSWAWLKDKWGNVGISGKSGSWKTARFREDYSGSIATIVKCIGNDGNPLAGQTVWCRDGGEVSAVTKENGTCDFCWGAGAYYPHGGTGPHSIAAGDVTVTGLGWLRYSDGSYSNHYHLNLELDKRGSGPPPEVPSAPTNVQASDGAYTDRVRVAWTASSGASSYEVYRATTTGDTGKLGTTTNTTYDDASAVVDTTYRYWVKACNSAGCSGFSNPDTGYRKGTEPPPENYVLGIDISSYQYGDSLTAEGESAFWFAGSSQTSRRLLCTTFMADGDFDWDAAQAAGVKFVLIRASAGLTPDSKFAYNWEQAGKRGMWRGAYHYLRQELDGQARCFVDAIGGRKLELGCWADIEQAGLTAAKCVQFLEATDRLTTHTTGIYTRASFFNAYGSPAWAQGRLLWVAHWGADSPTLPKAWNTWEFWQFSNQGMINGRRVDLNHFNGTIEQMKQRYGPPPEAENKPPVAAFTYTTDGLTCNLDASGSYDLDGTVASYAWSFGDGSTGSGKTTNHTYVLAGSYSVTLTVTDDDGAKNGVTKTVTVSADNKPPVAEFTYTVEGLTCNLDGSDSYDPDGTIVAYEWDFGDETPGAAGKTCSHTYAEAGIYTVTLVVEDNDGERRYTTHRVPVGTEGEEPVAEFSFSCVGLSCAFDASASHDPDGEVTYWGWSFGDGAIGDGETVNHTYLAAGSYQATLTVLDDIGLEDSITKTVTVPPGEENKPPTADFVHSVDSLVVLFDGALSSDPDGEVVDWAWSFGDGTTGTGKSTSHTYTATGSYSVTLTVTDNDGATGTKTVKVSVSEEEQPDIEKAKQKLKEAKALIDEALVLLEQLT